MKLNVGPETNITLSTDSKPMVTISPSSETDQNRFYFESVEHAKVMTFAFKAAAVYNNTMDITSFRTITNLGEDVAGRVLLVEYLQTGIVYALRVIPKDSMNSPGFSSAVTSLLLPNHPFIAAMEFSFSDAEVLYVGIKYPLYGQFSSGISDTKTALCEVCLAISFCHSNGLTFGGLQPTNVLFNADGHIQIVEFGIERKLCIDGAEMTPEVRNDGVLADWWSLGAMISNLESSLIEENHDSTQDLVSLLMFKDRKKRHEFQFERIKSHRFFDGVDWTAVLEGKAVIPTAKERSGLPSESTSAEEGSDDTTPPVDFHVFSFSDHQ